MNKTFVRGAIAAGAMLATSAAFAGNAVIDGNFTNPPGATTPPGFTTYFTGQAFGPWTVIGSGSGPYGNAGVDLIGNYWQSPPSGGGSVDLNGDAPGGIEQTILGLTAGDTYTLSFYLSGNPDGYPATKTVDVAIGSASDVLTYTITGSNSKSNMNWVLEDLTFQAGASNILSFNSLDGGGSPFGPVIGGVSIAVPEASTWAMMGLGLAGLAFAGYRGRRTTVAAAL